MTLSELTESDAATLSAMTDAELKEFCAPFLNVTRPEFATKPDPSRAKPIGGTSSRQQSARARAQKLAGELGLDLGFDD